MKNFLIAFSICAVWSFFALWLYSWLLPQDTQEAIVTPFSTTNTDVLTNLNNDVTKLDTLKIDDKLLITPNDTITIDTLTYIKKEPKIGLSARGQNNNVIFKFNETISFKKNEDTLRIPEEVLEFKYKINDYLLDHPENEIHIISRYSAQEDFESPNKGLIRGKHIKKQLTSVGVDSKLIVIKPRIEEIEFLESDIYENAISLEFKPLDQERIDLIKPAIIPDNLTFYPNFNNTGFLNDRKLTKLLDKINLYFEDNPNLNFTIIGHTDNTRNAVENYKTAMNYAESLRWHFISNCSIDGSRIKALSWGEAQPLYSNKTERGRIANRRIEIKFE